VRGGSKPQRDPGRFHGLVNDRQQLGREGVEVDLVAQAGRERLDGLGRVVAAPVEAPVNRPLNATAGRLEQRSGGQGGASDRPARRLGADPAEQLAEDQDDTAVDGA
jgi:hypothetical protein